MGRSHFRVIYNQDCTNLFGIVREPITPSHVDRMVDEVADGGADVMLINPQAQRTCYPSRVWQTMWDGYKPGCREFFGPIPDADVAHREHWVGQMKRLAEQGCDYLSRSLARCRKTGMTPGISVRMNDMHDVPWPGSHLYSRFYMDYPQWHLQNPSICGWSRLGLNYRHEEVREHYLSLIREFVGEYDFDVLDLDFLRFHCYFPREDIAANCEVMTEFIRDVRQVLDASGRHIALMARVAATPAAAYDLGFDVPAWAKLGLIDAITAGAFLNTAWTIPVDDFKRVVGDDVAVYASTDSSAGRPTDLPDRVLSLDDRRLRGFAAGHYATGADGIYVFNFFCARESTPRRDPLFAVLRELSDPSELQGSAKTYSLTTGSTLAEVDGPRQVDREAPTGRPQSFAMLLADEPTDLPIEVRVIVRGYPAGASDRFWLHINEYSARNPVELCPEPGAATDKSIFAAVFNVTGAALRPGRNELVFRNDGDTVTVLVVDLLTGG